MALSPSLAKQLRNECIIALSGADSVREKLLTLSNMGPSPLNQLAYAVKCRVKSEERLFNKVIHRRNSRNPNYRANSATDLVGLRIICLYSDELIVLARKFFDILNFAQDRQIKLFSGEAIDQAVREVIIFKTEMAGYAYDAVYQDIIALGVDKSKIVVKQATKEEPYSSIHIVCDAIYSDRYATKTIPVEVQIRTVFEDAWAEIDHPLRYKGVEFRSTIGTRRERGGDALYLQAKHQILGLKPLLDTASSHAETTRRLFEALDVEFGAKRGATKPANQTSIGNYRLPHQDIERMDYSAKKQVLDIDADIDVFYESLNSGEDIGKLSRQIEKVNGKIANLIGKESEYHIVYFLLTEYAMLLVWHNRILRESDAQGQAKGEIELAKALDIYYELFNDKRNESDALIAFRLANAISFKNVSIDLSLSLLEEAERRLEHDPRDRKDTSLIVWIPNQRALFLWKKTQQNRHAGSRLVGFGHADEAERLDQCIHYVLLAKGRLQSLFRDELLKVEHYKSEQTKLDNNLVSYLWDWSICTGKAHSAAGRLELEAIIKAVREVLSKYPRNINYTDTLCKIYHMTGDRTHAVATARQLKALADEGKNLSDELKSILYSTVKVIISTETFPTEEVQSAAHVTT